MEYIYNNKTYYVITVGERLDKAVSTQVILGCGTERFVCSEPFFNQNFKLKQ